MKLLAPTATPANGPDGDLVRRTRSGDRAAFSRLHQRYARAVYAVLLVRVPAQDARDLVQDVFATALDRLSGLDDPSAFGGWLMAIARNRAADFHRRRRPRAELGDDHRAPGPRAADAVEARRVLDAIRALPEAYREPLLMRLVEGMNGPEIAAATGLRPGSVRVNLHRGMKLLKQRLGVES